MSKGQERFGRLSEKISRIFLFLSIMGLRENSNPENKKHMGSMGFGEQIKQ